MLDNKKIIISIGSLNRESIKLHDYKNTYQEDKNEIKIDICTGDKYNEFEKQTRQKKWEKLHDPTQDLSLVIILKILLALLLLEIFLNQSSNSIYLAFKNYLMDSTAVILATLSVLAFILILLTNKNSNNVEISQIRSIILATFNENQRATILASKLAKKIANKNKKIEIWLHTYEPNSWVINGLVRNLVKINPKTIKIHVKKQNADEILNLLNEDNKQTQQNIELAHGFNKSDTINLESIYRTYKAETEVITNSLCRSILITKYKDCHEQLTEEIFFSKTKFELEINKYNLKLQPSMIIYDLIHNYSILKETNKHKKTLIVTTKLKQMEITDLDTSINPDAIELMIMLNTSNRQKDKQKYVTELINKIMENEDFATFNKWINTSEENSKIFTKGITPENLKKAITCLLISSQYDLATKICEAMLPYNKEEHKALLAYISQRKEKWTNREESVRKFKQIDEEKLSKENHEAYIEFLLNMTWSLIDQEKASDQDIIDALKINAKAISELSKMNKIYPDLTWHTINNEATILQIRGDLINSIEKHKQAAFLIGCSDKWRSGSMANLAKAYLTLYKQQGNPNDIDIALKYAQESLELKKAIGDEDEIQIAQRIYNECNLYLKDILHLSMG